MVSAGDELGSQFTLRFLIEKRSLGFWVHCRRASGSWEDGNDHWYYLVLAHFSIQCCLPLSETGSGDLKKAGFRFKFCVPLPLTETKSCAR